MPPQSVRTKLKLSGGALSRETQLFMSTVLAPIIQGKLDYWKPRAHSLGYGLTETCGMTTINTQDFKKHGTVGVLGPSTELKLNGTVIALKRRPRADRL